MRRLQRRTQMPALHYSTSSPMASGRSFRSSNLRFPGRIAMNQFDSRGSGRFLAPLIPLLPVCRALPATQQHIGLRTVFAFAGVPITTVHQPARSAPPPNPDRAES